MAHSSRHANATLPPITIQMLLDDGQRRLAAAGINSARLDVLILLEDVLGVDRSHILAHPEIIVSPLQLQTLETFIIRRSQHEPLAYIRGKADFYGRTFLVSKDVLTPRPESEAIIELLKNCHLAARPVIADLGSGSGCLGITAKLELEDATIYLCDISEAALKIASKNAERLGAVVQYNVQDLLLEDQRYYNVVLANLPYVPKNYPINQAATYEPAIALFSGIDGFAHYTQFWMQIAERQNKPDFIITESLLFQHEHMNHIARNAGYMVHEISGLAQCFKVF